MAEGINWTVNAGDYWVVAGLHGSGKSDFLMLTGGLMAPRRGQYRFFGEEMPIFEEARLKSGCGWGWCSTAASCSITSRSRRTSRCRCATITT